MIEQLLHSLGSRLPASLSRKLSPEDGHDAEAGDSEGCSDLLSANQKRSTAKDGRRDVCPDRCRPHMPDIARVWRFAECTAAVQLKQLICAQVVLSIETFSALQSKVCHPPRAPKGVHPEYGWLATKKCCRS